MLQAIRDHLTGWVATILFIIIGLAFALWGVPNQMSGNTSPALVNGDEIPLDEINRAIRGQLAQYRQYSEVTAENEKLIRANVLQGLVMDEVLSQHTREAGYRIGDEALYGHVRKIEQFQDQGQFSLELLRSRLAPEGVSLQYYEERTRRALRISQLRRGIVDTAFVTEKEIQDRARLEREQRRATWIEFSADAGSDQFEIGSDAVQAHYDANPGLYMRPESVDISYLELNLNDLAVQTDITDADIKEYYDSETAQGRFQEPEERQARHILIAVDADTDEATARVRIEDAVERLNSGEDFATLAAEISDDPGSAPEGGDLGWAQRTAYVGAFADALFSMQSGALSEPVRTQFGFHVIRMEGQRGGVPKPLEEVSADLRTELGLKWAEGQYYDLADQMRDLSFENSGSLEPVAEALAMELLSLNGVTRTAGQGIAANPAVIDAVFSESVLDLRQNSDPIEITSDSRVVVRVNDHHPAEVRPLDEVRETIVATLRAEAAGEYVSKQGEAALLRLQAGGALTELAAEYGAQLHEEDTYRRTSGLPPALRSALFKASRPATDSQTSGAVALGDGGYAVFALTEVIPGSVENPGAPEALASQQGIGDLSAYVQELRDDASVQLRPELLE